MRNVPKLLHRCGVERTIRKRPRDEGYAMLWCITTYFNPVGYVSRLENYLVFAERLNTQSLNLMTIELALGDQEFQLPASETTLQVRARSVLWQKERMLNWALTKLPPECTCIAWLDADMLFADDDWPAKAIALLKTFDAVQLFQKIIYLPPRQKTVDINFLPVSQNSVGHGIYRHGIAWQACSYPDWITLRRRGQLQYAVPGGAWAFRRSFITKTSFYDRHVLGGNDTIFADALFGCWGIHGYLNNSGNRLKRDALAWGRIVADETPRCSFLAQDVFHLFHGDLQNRSYIDRDSALAEADYDPQADIRLNGPIFEWSSDKPQLHAALTAYFAARREDG